MELPNSWKQITASQYIELNELQEEGFGSLFLYNLEILAILLDTDSEELEDMEASELLEAIDKIKWLRSEPSKKANQKIKGYTLKPFVNITLGEFIDLEHYFGLDYKTNLPTICAILYRATKEDEWNNVIFEPYKYDIEQRASLLEECKIVDLYGVIPSYLEFRESLRNSYPNFFAPDVEEDLSEMDEEDIEAEKKESRWGWESIIFNLANEDLTKVDPITDLPLIFVLNMLSMKADLKL